MINGTENIAWIIETYPSTKHTFEQFNLGKYLNKEVLEAIGKFTILNTLLAANGKSQEQFLTELNTHLAEEVKKSKGEQEHPDFMALLPCGLRNPIKTFIEDHIQENEEHYQGLSVMLDGNVNHELSYYPMLDFVESVDELPDVIIASDINNFFHKPFIDRFVNKGVFETYLPYEPNAYLSEPGFFDPQKRYTMLTANMLVVVADKDRLGERAVPTQWSDLLKPEYENDIIMRGEDDFFCNAVMLPFYKDHGMDAIGALALNIKDGKHPAEMVKLIEKEKSDEAAALYIMPYFFALRIKKQTAEIVWPSDGAISSPVFMLVKKSTTKKHKHLLDFLSSEAMGAKLTKHAFPSIHPNHTNDLPKAVKWLGWDFLTKHDIKKLKEEIQNHFMPIYTTKEHSV